jgi:hypothetical protein
MENKLQKKETNQLITKSEVGSKLNILVKGQTNNSKQLKDIRNDLQRGFIGLALRNEELLKSNDQLKQQLEEVLAGIKCNQRRTRRKGRSKASSRKSQTFTQA